MRNSAKLEYEENQAWFCRGDTINKVGEEYHAMRTRLIAIAPEHGPRLRSLATTSSDAEFVTALQDIIHEAMEELSLDHSEQGGCNTPPVHWFRSVPMSNPRAFIIKRVGE
ncbi:hypothetical protein J4727_07420 [Providencia rettgeri]|uniref:Uncharacterized protein n=1 Tax=Providencia rettgeri TaxID=587 RepID=A0A939NJY2_PRORE|nr:hypothetical protein [Providencia rettgeri]